MTPPTHTDFDPVTLEILWSRLISTTDESAAALLRTSFSTIVRESRITVDKHLNLIIEID